jgi:MFS transporter, FSR family, fosmidomycin resistance protein
VSADRRALTMLAAGHACADVCQGAVPALVPFLIAEGGLSYAQTGLLVLVMSLTSSVVQPLVGLWSDRHAANWTVPAGVALGGAGTAALGVAGSFGSMAAATAVAGLGIALFHPDGARRATVAAGSRAATGLSLFAVGGSAGFALAPVLLTPAVVLAGLPGTAILLVPTLLVAAALTRLPTAARAAAATTGRRTGGDRRGAFVLLTLVASLRAGAYFGAQAFLAAALIARLDASTAAGNAALAALLTAGAAGTLAGGRLADLIGHRAVIVGSLGATVPALALTLAAPTPALTITAAALLGLTVVAGYSATVVLGQQLLVSRPSLAAGTTLGLAIGAGGLIVAALGPLADAAGPTAALWAIAGVAALGALVARGLPDSVVPA